ncbi:unnamed protein product [Allacma fusca]|uniref:Malate synthase n=1 Tax=Allacma fusca TaxID=39272 RepID=A0A8J2KX94_9HEXA|nr:unnamed protein product [Allacma fusca]
MEVASCPPGKELEYKNLFTPEALLFLQELVTTFEYRVREILRTRKIKKLILDKVGDIPDFAPKGSILNTDWKVGPLPKRLQNRHLDLGDVAPSNADHLKAALNANVQGIQVDYDDGCCPSWGNLIAGLHNIVAFARGEFFPNEVPSIESSPILMLRPRAWNMNEHNILVRGREIPGPLMDFGLLIFHTGKILASFGAGPFFYLSKVEGSNEAELWNDIFIWAQHKIGLPYGTIKACVLIENILASFEMEEILFALKDHSLGLNCGIWDYAASFVNKFGTRREFLLPDRNKYVNMEKHFLASYMKLVVQTCHKRGAMATGGMAALTVDESMNESERMEITEKVCKAKLREIHSGVDGFMVYDVQFVPWINELWNRYGSLQPNQIKNVLHQDIVITGRDLLLIPTDGAVEDSATAEISRSQIWQWIYHQAKLEDSTREPITKQLVVEIVRNTFENLKSQNGFKPNEVSVLETSCQIFVEVVTASEFPEFITTYLYNHSSFRRLQGT